MHRVGSRRRCPVRATAGATLRIEALLDEARRGPRRAGNIVRERLGRGARLPGFGHPLYPDGDPRARVLIERALELGAERRARPRALRTIQLRRRTRACRRPTSTSASCCSPRRSVCGPAPALFVFAVGRLAGWVAHILEQRTQGEQLRPRARYVGIVRP